MFADDSNLFLFNENIENLLKIVNLELSKLSTWFRANKLSLNVKKTNYIMFGRKQATRGHPSQTLYIEGVEVAQVNVTKFLGVFIDDILNWKNHINHIKLQCSKGFGIMSRVRSFLPRSVMIMLYRTLIYPYLEYCNLAWGAAKPTILNQLLLI